MANRFGASRVGFIVTSVALVGAAVAVVVGTELKGRRDAADLTRPVGTITTQATVQFDPAVAPTTQRAAAAATRSAATTAPRP